MSAFFNMPAVEKLLEDKGLAHAEISALRELVQLEWVHFDTVQGMSGRAACQDDAVGVLCSSRCPVPEFSSRVHHGCAR